MGNDSYERLAIGGQFKKDARNRGSEEIRAAGLRIGQVGKHLPTFSKSFAIGGREKRIVAGGTVIGGEALGMNQYRFKFQLTHHWFGSVESHRQVSSRDQAGDGLEESTKM